jgi:hypothetical protein
VQKLGRLDENCMKFYHFIHFALLKPKSFLQKVFMFLCKKAHNEGFSGVKIELPHGYQSPNNVKFCMKGCFGVFYQKGVFFWKYGYPVYPGSCLGMSYTMQA